MILGRPWLATTDAYISCRKGEMIISNGLATKKITLHPPAQLASINALWVEDPYEHNAMEQLSINVEQTRKLQEKTKENILDQFLSTDYYENLNDPKDLENFDQYHHIFSQYFQENYDFTQPLTTSVMTISEKLEPDTLFVEISLGKSLYINLRLDSEQQMQLIHILQKQSRAFTWEYKDMKGIHLDTCIHHIYTQENVRPIRKL